MVKLNNPLLDTFKHVFVAMFGVVSAWAMIGLYSAFFVGIGYFIIRKYNKPNTKLLKELQTGQYFGLVFIFFGLLPFIQYFFMSFAMEGGSAFFNSLMDS
tara:strand:+ start:54 stop:353 length:300 start_codon:yes stop_codon:yes gene_type:complete